MDGQWFASEVRKCDVNRKQICIFCIILFRHIGCSTPVVRFILACPYNAKKSRKCSKPRHHVGKCDSKKQFNRFWEESAFYKLKISQADVSKAANDVATREAAVCQAEDIMVKRQEMAKDETSAAEKIATAGMFLGTIQFTVPQYICKCPV